MIRTVTVFGVGLVIGIVMGVNKVESVKQSVIADLSQKAQEVKELEKAFLHVGQENRRLQKEIFSKQYEINPLQAKLDACKVLANDQKQEIINLQKGIQWYDRMARSFVRDTVDGGKQ